MKKFLICLLFPFSVCALSSDMAKENIDLNKKIDVSIHYNYKDYVFDDLNVYIYHVASIDEEYHYELVGDFANYTINDLSSSKDTINSYIEADGIVGSNHVIVDNKIELNDMEAGLYFVKMDKINNDDYVLEFDSFLINLPDLNEDGSWNYDVDIYPKALEFISKDTTYRVIKKWCDDGTRPNNILVDIYENGNLYDNISLSSEDNWVYEWVGSNASEWTLMERNIDGYEVKILNEGNDFIIVNKALGYEIDNPHTVDNINVFFYVFLFSLIGILLTVFVFRKKAK